MTEEIKVEFDGVCKNGETFIFISMDEYEKLFVDPKIMILRFKKS